ncbi:MAG: hypothetical protein GY941_08760 [Planctomycetes bacterium]|nr:hypothetical protein [Planctomycetota bacterium]
MLSKPLHAEIWHSHCFNYSDFATAEANHNDCIGIASDPLPIDEANSNSQEILAQSIDRHAEEVRQLNENMTEFFTLSTTDFSLITAGMLAIFITGNAIGKVAYIMRKN